MRFRLLGALMLVLAVGTAIAISTSGPDGPPPEQGGETGVLGERLAQPALARYVAGSAYSGYILATDQTRAMQDDDDVNPGFMWVERGRVLWTAVEGSAGRSCASCHYDVEDSMLGAATRYPRWSDARGKPVNLEQQINICRVNGMGAPAWKYESEELLAMTALVRLQSRGQPLDVAVDGPMRAWHEKGRAFYYGRRGQLDFACNHCHEDHHGDKVRSEVLSQGQINGFPTYRLKWQKLGSAHRRFAGCNEEIRAEPYPLGSDEYLALEVFLADRGRGLPIEAPSVRK